MIILLFSIFPTYDVMANDTITLAQELPDSFGDVNIDGVINANDALMVLQHAVTLISLTEDHYSYK